MSGPISRVPRGLTSLLELRGLAINPSELAEFVIPQLDLLNFYQADKRERGIDSFSSAHSALFPGARLFGTDFTTVPDDELHIVWHLSYESLALHANVTSLRWSPNIRVGGSPTSVILRDPSPVFTAGEAIGFTMNQVPLFALPGTRFGIYVIDGTFAGAATISWSFAKEFTRLKM